MEEWKDIPNTRGAYQASSLGQIKSLNYNKTGVEQILRQNRLGEYWATSIDNKRTYIHRLIARAFLSNPYNLPEVDHINRNKEDNRVDNLRWVTKSQNAINRPVRPCKSAYSNIHLSDEGNWRVDIRRKFISYRYTFPTLEEAITARDDFLQALK